MKRTITLLFALLIAFAASAQSHMKFMGIPLDGTIDAFQQKLAAKGVQPERGVNEILPVGMRNFIGMFCGYEAEIVVFYNTKTKTVYRAKAFFENENKELIQRRYDEFLRLLNNKYSDAAVTESEYDGFDACSWLVWGEGRIVGEIDLFVSENSSSYLTQYTLYIDYTDAINNDANNASKSEDL